jgi:hypothetical protein
MLWHRRTRFDAQCARIPANLTESKGRGTYPRLDRISFRAGAHVELANQVAEGSVGGHVAQRASLVRFSTARRLALSRLRRRALAAFWGSSERPTGSLRASDLAIWIHETWSQYNTDCGPKLLANVPVVPSTTVVKTGLMTRVATCRGENANVCRHSVATDKV